MKISVQLIYIINFAEQHQDQRRKEYSIFLELQPCLPIRLVVRGSGWTLAYGERPNFLCVIMLDTCISLYFLLFLVVVKSVV